jgi:hypothetical protein
MTRADFHALTLMLLCLALIGMVALAFDGGRLPRRIARSRRKGQQIKFTISQPCAVRPAQVGSGDAGSTSPVATARVGVRPPARATFSPVIRPTTGDGGTDCSHPHGAANFSQPASLSAVGERGSRLPDGVAPTSPVLGRALPQHAGGGADQDVGNAAPGAPSPRSRCGVPGGSVDLTTNTGHQVRTPGRPTTYST